MPVFSAGGPGVPGKQAQMRRNVNPVDQFGRRWLTAYELSSGESTGGWQVAWGPMGDPLKTPGKYLAFTTNEAGQTEPTRCRVDMDRWIGDIEQDEQIWYQQLHQNAGQVYKRGSLDPEQVLSLDQDTYLLNLTGPKPFPSSEVLRRAKAGHRAFLGLAPLNQADRADLRMPSLEDLKTPPVEEHVPQVTSTELGPPDTYPAFVQWCFKTKQVTDLKQAAQLWQEHRALLAEA